METLVESTLRDILGLMGVSFNSITLEELAGQKIFTIDSTESKELIGAHGDTIQAIDMLVKKIVEKKLATPEGAGAETHFLVDVNGYRAQHIKDLQQKALMMAERARSFQYDVELSPMSSYERLIVHASLQGAPNVKTESQGEGRSRRVVIRYQAA